MQSYSLPSNSYISLTLGASGSTYTAPADGYFYVKGGASSGTRAVEIHCNGMSVSGTSVSGIRNAIIIMPVKQGNTVSIPYSIDVDKGLRFIYATGSQPA